VEKKYIVTIDGDEWLTPRPGRFNFVSGTRCTRGWVDSRAGLDSYEKSHTPLPVGFETRTVQPVAIRYTDYTILATTLMNMVSQNDNCQQGH